MPSLAHWNIPYAKARIALALYAFKHPDAPWIAPDAARFLEAWLQPAHVGFEWGAGRSTTWFASRVARLTSIEHNQEWYERVHRNLLERSESTVILKCIAKDDREYVDTILAEPDHTLDFVLVDGVSDQRDACAWAALPKIAENGLLIVDDVHRYLPSASCAPLALAVDAAPLTSLWGEVSLVLKGWKKHLFSSGVTDTAIWIRPATV
ncbi:MAG TPA: class I SAM-dependent methyltransferase [Candidatus Hydrogenedentes bacterium]|nr:class I SAM-dependent methyltransferase [Candidatus Hydrogenedentota bacterium]